MQQQIDVSKVSPAVYQAVAALQSYVDKSGLDPSLRELIKIRASQINGCAFCLAMHTRDARKLGETDERMHLLNAWREAPLYGDRERAALAWVEAITLVAQGHVPDDVFDAVPSTSQRRRSSTSLPPQLPSIAGTGSRSRFACRPRSKARKRRPKHEATRAFGAEALACPSSGMSRPE